MVRQGGALVIAGISAGIAAALYLSTFLAAALFGVAPRDGVVFVSVPVALALIGLGTGAIVARRAGRVDPLEALRHD